MNVHVYSAVAGKWCMLCYILPQLIPATVVQIWPSVAQRCALGRGTLPPESVAWQRESQNWTKADYGFCSMKHPGCDAGPSGSKEGQRYPEDKSLSSARTTKFVLLTPIRVIEGD